MRRAVDIAIEEGHLAPDTDAAQMAFEIHALILALHYEARFLRSPDSASRAVRAFENIVTRFGNTQAPAPRKTATRSPAAARTQG